MTYQAATLPGLARSKSELVKTLHESAARTTMLVGEYLELIEDNDEPTLNVNAAEFALALSWKVLEAAHAWDRKSRGEVNKG